MSFFEWTAQKEKRAHASEYLGTPVELEACLCNEDAPSVARMKTQSLQIEPTQQALER